MKTKTTNRNAWRVLLKLCPTCHTDLVPGHHAGIPVDQCTRCNGLWMAGDTMEQFIHALRTTESTASTSRAHRVSMKMAEHLRRWRRRFRERIANDDPASKE